MAIKFFLAQTGYKRDNSMKPIRVSLTAISVDYLIFVVSILSYGSILAKEYSIYGGAIKESVEMSYQLKEDPTQFYHD